MIESELAINDKIFLKALEAEDAKDYATAFTLYQQLANQGDTNAMLSLGSIYILGRGVSKNPELALYWEKKAIELGNESALGNLAISYRWLRNIRLSKYYFEQSLQKGDDENALELARMYQVSDKEQSRVKAYLQQVITGSNVSEGGREEANALLASLSNPDLNTVYAQRVYRGDSTKITVVQKTTDDNNVDHSQAEQAFQAGDYPRAFQLYLPFAKQGNLRSIVRIGNMYEEGEGVGRSFGRAMNWYLKAGRHNYLPALLALGYGYQKFGYFLKARYWFEQALKQDSAEAALQLANMYQISELDWQQGKYYLQRALEIGHFCSTCQKQVAELQAIYLDLSTR